MLGMFSSKVKASVETEVKNVVQEKIPVLTEKLTAVASALQEKMGDQP